MVHAFVPDEAGLAPVAGSAGWTQPVYFAHDQIMLNDYFVSKGVSAGNAVAYAFSYVNVPSAQRAELWVGSDESMSVVLNGAKVYGYTGTRAFAGTECYKDTVSVALRKGLNTLLVKVLQTTGNFNFTVNICEPEPDPLYRGNRVWGLKFVSGPGAVNEVSEPDIPGGFALEQNYPNPFNPSTRIAYRTPAGAARPVRLTVYDLAGREVAVLVNGEEPGGEHVATWNAAGKASGVYFYHLAAGGQQAVRKMLLVK
jgi:hypothetical protein